MENRRLAERATKIAEKLADQRDALAQELQERDDFSEATSFKLLMRLCGLSQKETAEFLGVSVESIKAWSGHGSRDRGRSPAPARGWSSFTAGLRHAARKRPSGSIGNP